MDEGDTRAFVARLAPQVDRLYVGGHAAARPLAGEVRERFGLQGFGLLIALRPVLLAPEGVPLPQATAILRYQDPAHVCDALRAHTREGLLQEVDAIWRPTLRGREVLLALTDVLEQSVSRLWSRQGDAVLAALEALLLVIPRARDTLDLDLFPAFAAQVRGYLPPAASDAFRLWSCLQAVRYLRADAHARAWEEAGLDRVTVQCLSDLHHRQDGADVVQMKESTGLHEADIMEGLERLVHAGWGRSEAGRWRITEGGQTLRSEIEERTDEFNAGPFAVLGDAGRARVLQRLERLID